MLLIKRDLPLSDQAIAEYVESWRGLLDSAKTLRTHEVQRGLFDHLYNNLSILDNKANGLLQLSGILVAAFTFVTTEPALQTYESARFLLGAGSAYAATAVFLCLKVIWLHWSSRSDLDNGQQHMRSLILIRSQRTIQYRRAWTFALVSLVALILTVLDLAIFKLQYPIRGILAGIVIAHFFVAYIYDDLVLAWRHWFDA